MIQNINQWCVLGDHQEVGEELSERFGRAAMSPHLFAMGEHPLASEQELC